MSRDPQPRRRHAAITASGALAGVALAVTALAGCTSAPTADARTRILVSVDRCGSGWSSPVAGQQHFALADVDTRAGEVYLTDAKTGAVYAEVDPLGPGTTADMDVYLGSGSYAFRCAMEDEATVVGPTVTVPGHVAPSATPVAAVSQAELVPATLAYESYVKGRIPTLAALVDALQADIAANDIGKAKTDWIAAHVEYERLGAAYGAFGDLDGEINGLPEGLPKGTADPDWTGFHRVEYGLWHGESAASLAAPTAALADAVGQLGDEFAAAQIDPLELSIRAHEITENALEFELTGRTDFGSHSNLATIAANLEGTSTVLGILDPLLTSRDPQLPQTLDLLAKAKGDVAASGSDLSALSTAQRERLDADLSQLSEELAPIASILEPRRVNQ
jgi:iron uptake system component EfeO